MDEEVIRLLEEMGYKVKPGPFLDDECVAYGLPTPGMCSEECFVYSLMVNQLHQGGVGAERVKEGVRNRVENCRKLEKI